MRLATVEQSQTIDRAAQDSEYELSSDVLMEAAGSLAAREIQQSFLPELRRGAVAILCGPGHNGGDGLVVARHLHSSGHRDLEVFLLAAEEKRADLFKRQLARCQKQGVKTTSLLPWPGRHEPARKELSDRLARFQLVVDALFGIGLNAELRSPERDVVEVLNGLRYPIVSLDVPSGLDADRGVVLGAAVRAEQTLTFGLAKPGFFVSDGPSHVGRLRVLSIGLPRKLMRERADSHFLFAEAQARRQLPRRHPASNKSTHGRAMIFAGQEGMWGAALLAASAAYRVGAGFVSIASFADPQEVVRQSPEVLSAHLMEFPSDPRVDARPNPRQDSFWSERKWNVAGIGPGLGTGENTKELLKKLLRMNLRTVVVDADAITVAARHGLFPFPESWILTPHAGELSRILGIPASEIERNRFDSVRRAVRVTGCHVLLKGYRSILSYRSRSKDGSKGEPSGLGEKTWVIHAGNSALAKAGTGDVLTGMITGLLAQGLKPGPATATAAYLHGRLADEWVRRGLSRRSLQASDLREALPDLLARMKGQGSRRDSPFRFV